MDSSLAVLAGSLLCAQWLKSLQLRAKSQLAQLSQAATGVLLLALCVHFALLTADFSGAASFTQCVREMPGMIVTHAGKMDVLGIGAALLLTVLVWLPVVQAWRSVALTALLCCVLLLRAASGHAATEGDFTLSELLQGVHLCSMAVWSGAILVSGLYVLPRLRDEVHATSTEEASSSASVPESSPARLTYMRQLSRVSTWAVALVFVTGLLKSYRALGGSLGHLRSGGWGYILLLKISCVVLALCLGALNRLWLQRKHTWDARSVHRSMLALRLEAVCMLLILALSAALGSVNPPDIS